MYLRRKKIDSERKSQEASNSGEQIDKHLIKFKQIFFIK